MHRQFSFAVSIINPAVASLFGYPNMPHYGYCLSVCLSDMYFPNLKK